MLVPIGRFGRPHGVRGEIRFWPFNRDSTLLTSARRIQVGRHRERTRAYTIDGLRTDAKGCLVRFAEIDDRDVAKGLTNQMWFESRDVFPELADDEVYYTDLIGLVVRTVEGEIVGRVKDVLDIGPSDILVIDRDGQEVMVPNVDEFVRSMDLDAGEITITPPAGLIDGE